MDLQNYFDILLDKATNDFFSDYENFDSICYNRSCKLKNNTLFSHLNDNMWLARRFKLQENLYYVSFNYVFNYVSTSVYFAEQKKKYERSFVAKKIKIMLNNFCEFSEVCDISFRQSIVDELIDMGMNLDVIEDAIEYNSDLWRDSLMEAVFNYLFEFTSYLPNYVNGELNFIPVSLEPADSVYKEKWLKMRKYEYYQMNKQSVDLYGDITPEMLMTKEEVFALQEYLTKKNKERLETINEFKLNIQNQFIFLEAECDLNREEKKLKLVNN